MGAPRWARGRDRAILSDLLQPAVSRVRLAIVLLISNTDAAWFALRLKRARRQPIDPGFFVDVTSAILNNPYRQRNLYSRGVAPTGHHALPGDEHKGRPDGHCQIVAWSNRRAFIAHDSTPRGRA